MKKLLGIKKIATLDIDMYRGQTRVELKAKYKKLKKDKIVEYMTDYDKTKNEAEGSFLKHTGDFKKWLSNYTSLNTHGEQRVIDKINEIVKAINKL